MNNKIRIFVIDHCLEKARKIESIALNAATIITILLFIGIIYHAGYRNSICYLYLIPVIIMYALFCFYVKDFRYYQEIDIYIKLLTYTKMDNRIKAELKNMLKFKKIGFLKNGDSVCGVSIDEVDNIIYNLVWEHIKDKQTNGSGDEFIKHVKELSRKVSNKESIVDLQSDNTLPIPIKDNLLKIQE